MKILSALLLALVAVAFTQTPYVDPNTLAQRVYDVPYGTAFGLDWNTDTLHVTTDEKGWVIGTGAVKLTIINPNNTTLTIRISNVAGILVSYVGAYGTRIIEAPGSIVSGSLLDSLFVDGSASCTVYIDWWD